MEVVSIILRLKNQEIRVSADEARELLGQLTAVFGGAQPIIFKEKEYVPFPMPYPVEPAPVYPWYSKPWWDTQPIIIYSDGTQAIPTWNDNTCTVSTCDTGKILFATTYSNTVTA